MSCKENPALTALGEQKSLIEAQIAAGRATFDSAKAQVESTLSTVTDAVNGIIGGAQSALDGVLSNVQSTLDGLVNSLPNVTSIADDVIALVGKDVTAISAFVQKWEGAAGFDEISQRINEGPAAFAAWVASIEPCKDLPNSVINNDTGEVSLQPTEVAPPSENPENPETLESTVIDNTIEESTGQSRLLESEVIIPMRDYKNSLYNMSVLSDLYDAENEYVEFSRSTLTRKSMRNAKKRNMSLADYMNSQYVTQQEVDNYQELLVLRENVTNLRTIASTLMLYVQAYQKKVGLMESISDEFHEDARETLSALNGEMYFDEAKDIIDRNTGLIEDYYEYAGIR